MISFDFFVKWQRTYAIILFCVLGVHEFQISGQKLPRFPSNLRRKRSRPFLEQTTWRKIDWVRCHFSALENFWLQCSNQCQKSWNSLVGVFCWSESSFDNSTRVDPLWFWRDSCHFLSFDFQNLKSEIWSEKHHRPCAWPFVTDGNLVITKGN